MEEKKVKTIKKKKINIKKLIIFLLFLYLLISGIIYLINLPIKNIYISGNYRLTDNEIITTAGIKNYPSIFKIRKSTITKKLNKLPLIKDVIISKNVMGKITIEIQENKILFLQKSSNLIYLENKKTITENSYLGVPILLNYVPEEIFDKMITSFAKLDTNIIEKISEIEYSPYKGNNDQIIDNERFLLRMNDRNTVYINLPNIKKLNYYNKIYAELESQGILYLDSEDEENFVFVKYE